VTQVSRTTSLPDTDILADILARIVAMMSASVSASWNARFTAHHAVVSLEAGTRCLLCFYYQAASHAARCLDESVLITTASPATMADER